MGENKVNKRKTVGYTMVVAGITAVLCLLLFLFVGYKYFLNPDVQFENDQAFNPQVTLSKKISIPGFDTWTIDAGKTKASTRFYNPESNTCYFVVSVILNDTGEVIYKSKYIKPGQVLYEVELKRAMEHGTYDATLHYDTYSIADNSPMNGADVPFQLVVN